MKNISIAIVTFVILVSGCKRTAQSDLKMQKHNWKFDQLSVKKQLYLNDDSTKNGMHLAFELNYPSEFENDSLLKQIQSVFVMAYGGEDFANVPPSEAFKSVVDKEVTDGLELGKLAKDDGNDFSEYYKTVVTSVFDTTAITITAKTNLEDYTGGAHGSYLTYYYTVDLRNGDIIRWKDLFATDSERHLISFIKEVLKTTLNKMGDPITLLDPDDVTPNDNFYFDEEGIVFVYNQYEIAPYSDGLIKVAIPYAKIKELMLPQYQIIAKIKTKTE